MSHFLKRILGVAYLPTLIYLTVFISIDNEPATGDHESFIPLYSQTYYHFPHQLFMLYYMINHIQNIMNTLRKE